MTKRIKREKPRTEKTKRRKGRTVKERAEKRGKSDIKGSER